MKRMFLCVCDFCLIIAKIVISMMGNAGRYEAAVCYMFKACVRFASVRWSCVRHVQADVYYDGIIAKRQACTRALRVCLFEAADDS